MRDYAAVLRRVAAVIGDESPADAVDIGELADALEVLPSGALEHPDGVAALFEYMDDYSVNAEHFTDALDRLRVLEKVHDALPGFDLDALPDVVDSADPDFEELRELLVERVGKDPVDKLAHALWRLHLVPASAGVEQVADALARLCHDTTVRLSVSD